MEPSLYVRDSEISGIEALTIHQPDDYEGPVICTLLRKKSLHFSVNAVLHIHGFNDYFFQYEAAEVFSENGFNFYAVDLRKSGRSYLKHQKHHNIRCIEEYFEDLISALEIIKSEGNENVTLIGHSLGGLAAVLFAEKYSDSVLFNNIFLNSPFLEQNKDIVTRKFLIPFVSFLAKKWPDISIPGSFSKFYGPSIHINDFGEWKYNLTYKPHSPAPVNSGWVRAVNIAQKKIRKGVKLNHPCLIMYSSKSIQSAKWIPDFLQADAVLNILHSRKYSKCIKGKVEIVEIDNAMHDLFLSGKEVRQKVYKHFFTWKSNNQ